MHADVQFEAETLHGCNIDVLHEGDFFIKYEAFVAGTSEANPVLHRFIGEAAEKGYFLAYVENTTSGPVSRMRFPSGTKVIQAKVKITVTGYHPC